MLRTCPRELRIASSVRPQTQLLSNFVYYPSYYSYCLTVVVLLIVLRVEVRCATPARSVLKANLETAGWSVVISVFLMAFLREASFMSKDFGATRTWGGILALLFPGSITSPSLCFLFCKVGSTTLLSELL